MRLFITGASGLIGRRLVLDRLERGDQVVLLSRDASRVSKMFAADANRNVTVVQGNPATSGQWQQAVDGCDAVIHLAGAGIADRRWTAAYKQTLRSSRIDSTHQVVAAIEQASLRGRRPRVLINASAIGYYGDAGERELDESAPPGRDFLAQLCVSWEQQAMRAEAFGMRVVTLRTGVVLDDRGGALRKMMTPFKLFVGGPIGSGRQYMSWIHWRDLMGLIDLALEPPAAGSSELRGPLNAVSPEPVRQREFAATLGALMGRPSWLPTPRWLLRLAMGEVADAITASQRVLPRKAQQHGYVFLYPSLEGALESLLQQHYSAVSDPPSVINPTSATLPTAPANGAPANAVDFSSQPLANGSQPTAMPAAPIKLLAIAVDGTLLRTDGSIAQWTVQACRSAERRGCVVVLASARPPRGLRSILQALDITGPTINYNGAVIWNPLDGRPQYHEALPGDLARQIVAEARSLQPSIIVGLEVLDRWYTDRIDPRLLSENGQLTEPDYIGPLDQFFLAPVTKINLLCAPEQAQALLDLIRQRWWHARQVAVFRPSPNVIQVTAPLVDKGIALQRIARRMGLSRDSVMAIGDSVNDMGMIEWAGFGVAMGNAPAAVQRLAKVTTATNDDMGVAKAIHRYVLR